MTSSPPSPAVGDLPNESSSSSDNEEANTRREAVSHDSGRSKLPIEELRKRSRRDYLATRKDKKLHELEDEIRDEEYLFKGVKLTKREQEDIKFKKIALNLALEHEKAQKMENIDRYYMPTGKSDDTSKHDRYREDNRHPDGKSSAQNSDQRKFL